MIGIGVLLARLARAVHHAAEKPEFRGLMLVAVGLVVTGTAVYSITEHWSVVNGLYFAVSTLTTTSPNGLTLTHDVDKLFTVVYILLGIGVLAEFIRQIAAAYGEMKQEKRAARAG
jgi:voltage-gated potassium channel